MLLRLTRGKVKRFQAMVSGGDRLYLAYREEAGLVSSDLVVTSHDIASGSPTFLARQDHSFSISEPADEVALQGDSEERKPYQGKNTGCPDDRGHHVVRIERQAAWQSDQYEGVSQRLDRHRSDRF